MSNDKKPATVSMIGVPSDEFSSFMKGCEKAPDKIREVLHCGSANLCSELGVNLEGKNNFQDLGNLEFNSGEKGFDQITDQIQNLLDQETKPLILGGDHAITYPIIKGFQTKFEKLTLLHFDAHADLYEEFEGNRLSHACPFARIMEEGLATDLFQVGIRTMNDHQRQQAERFGVDIIEARDFRQGMKLDLSGPLYISLDLDVLDPAFAPGISHHEPGGLSVRDVLDVIQRIKVPIVGADIVEYNPRRDLFDMTAMVAAKFIKEIAGKMIRL
jgi:arginase